MVKWSRSRVRVCDESSAWTKRVASWARPPPARDDGDDGDDSRMYPMINGIYDRLSVVI